MNELTLSNWSQWQFHVPFANLIFPKFSEQYSFFAFFISNRTLVSVSSTFCRPHLLIFITKMVVFCSRVTLPEGIIPFMAWQYNKQWTKRLNLVFRALTPWNPTEFRTNIPSIMETYCGSDPLANLSVKAYFFIFVHMPTI